MSDLIRRDDAIDALSKAMPSLTTPDGCGQFDREIYVAQETFVDAMQIIHDMPSAEPEQKLDECCTDCKEYDQEKHCCHRWNRVIRTTVEEMKQQNRHGKWLNNRHSYWRFLCSECNGLVSRETKYCPECGAKMIKDDEQDNPAGS